MSVLRVGIAGAGWVSEYHLNAWAALRDRASVVAIADPELSRAQARAAQFGIPNVFASVEQMLAAVELDAIDIAAPREAHAPICKMAARQGLAILCQKPLAPSLQEAEALVAELSAETRLMVHDNWRFRPHYREIGKWLRQGSLGEIRTVLMSVLTSGLLPDGRGQLPALVRQPMLAALERMLLMEVLIHHLDTLRFLLGPLILEGAQLGHNCDAIRGEDRAALLLRTSAGASISLVGDFMAHGRLPEQRDELQIFGTTGAIVLREQHLDLSGAHRKSEIIDLAANYRASYKKAIEHFIDRLDDGGPFETSPADHLETLRIVEAAYGQRSR